MHLWQEIDNTQKTPSVVRNYSDGDNYQIVEGQLKDSGLSRVYSIIKNDNMSGETTEIISDIYPFEEDWSIGVSPCFSIVDDCFYYIGICYEQNTGNLITAKGKGVFYFDVSTKTVQKINSELACPIASFNGFLLFSSEDYYSNFVHVLNPNNTYLVNKNEYISGSINVIPFQMRSTY